MDVDGVTVYGARGVLIIRTTAIKRVETIPAKLSLLARGSLCGRSITPNGADPTKFLYDREEGSKATLLSQDFIEIDRRPLFIHTTAYRAMEWAADGRSYSRVRAK